MENLKFWYVHYMQQWDRNMAACNEMWLYQYDKSTKWITYEHSKYVEKTEAKWNVRASYNVYIKSVVQGWANICTWNESFSPSEATRLAHLHQHEIGFDFFVKGIICIKWTTIQEDDYAIHRLPRQYNIIRWKKSFTVALLSHSVDLWNERCTIVQALATHTHETRTREQAIEYCTRLRSARWRIPHDCHHLLSRDDKYFRTTPMINVTKWYKNIQSALDRGKT